MANINNLITEAKLTHRELSNRTGYSQNWFFHSRGGVHPSL